MQKLSLISLRDPSPNSGLTKPPARMPSCRDVGDPGAVPGGVLGLGVLWSPTAPTFPVSPTAAPPPVTPGLSAVTFLVCPRSPARGTEGGG